MDVSHAKRRAPSQEDCQAPETSTTVKRKWYVFRCSVDHDFQQIFLSEESAFAEGWRGVEAEGMFTDDVRITAWACPEHRPLVRRGGAKNSTNWLMLFTGCGLSSKRT